MYFEFDIEDKYILDNYTDEVQKNAESVLDEKKNGKILFFKDKEYNLAKYNKRKTMLPPVLFYKGNIKLLEEKSISVVGTRNPTELGKYNTKRISEILIKNEITIVSGLAKGIDKIAHDTARKREYRKLIGVIGTPLSKFYPKENIDLQEYIISNGLLISEFASFEITTKISFLRRNYIMSCISRATIVVEAGDTSGSINQAKHTLKNGKKLFIPHNVFKNPNNTWPKKYMEQFDLIFEFYSIEELLKLLSEV